MKQKHKQGDVRADGKIFVRYQKQAKGGEYWTSQSVYDKIVSSGRLAAKENYKKQFVSKTKHINKIMIGRKTHAKDNGIPFDISKEYLISISTDKCPILGLELSWCQQKGRATDNSPSLDRIIPELGYVEGNVAWISYRANMIKSNATSSEVQAVANWMKNNNA